jgi:hypothetical protein
MTQERMQAVLDEINFVESVYKKLLHLLPSFEIANINYLPYGLKPHTRSVSWIVEQVITQQTKFHQRALGLTHVEFDLPDTCLHDCVLSVGQKKYYVNIKIHNMDGKDTRNDIAAVEKLYIQYRSQPDYDLIYACFGIRFAQHSINFDVDYLKLFSPQFLPVYVNPRNDKIQALYHHNAIYRTRKEFLDLLVQHSKTIKLSNDHF